MEENSAVLYQLKHFFPNQEQPAGAVGLRCT